MNRSKGSIVRACLIIALLMMVFAGGASVASAAPLKIAYSDWPGYVVWEIAVQKNYFKDAGVDAQMVWFEYGPSIDAFAAGKVDGGTFVCGDALVTGAGGKPASLIVLEDYSNGGDMIIGKPGVKSITELKGKKVGLEQNLVEQLLLLKGLEMNGMKETDVTIVNVSTNDTPQTLASGSVDAIGAWYPISSQALRTVPGARPLFTSANAPGLIYDALFVNRESLAQHPAEWRKIVGVWFRCMDYLNNPATHDDAVKIMAARVSVPPAQFQKSMKGTAFLDYAGNMKSLEKRDTLDSVYGSMKNADAFNLKFKVYKDPQNVDSYIYSGFVKEIKK